MRHRLSALVFAAALAAGCTVHGPDTCGQIRPSARTGTVAVLVPTTNQVYLYGGQTAQSLDAADLWRYDFVGGCANGGWTQLHLETMPRDIGAYAAAFDSKRNRILYLSFDSQTVWALDSDGLKWSQLRPTGALTAASADAGAVYDEEHDRLLVGSRQLRFGASDDGEWSALPLQANMKLPVIGPASAVDPVRRAVYSLDDQGVLTVYTFLTDTQQPVALAGDAFGTVVGARMGWDSQAKRMVVFAPDGASPEPAAKSPCVLRTEKVY